MYPCRREQDPDHDKAAEAGGGLEEVHGARPRLDAGLRPTLAATERERKATGHESERERE